MTGVQIWSKPLHSHSCVKVDNPTSLENVAIDKHFTYSCSHCITHIHPSHRREDSFITPAWMWEVIYRAPLLYLDYYLTDKAAQLPPRRQACLLRAAIKTANTELAVLLERIRAHEVSVLYVVIVLYVAPCNDMFCECAHRCG